MSRSSVPGRSSSWSPIVYRWKYDPFAAVRQAGPSDHQKPAVDFDHLPVDEAGLIGAQENYDVGGLLRCPQAARGSGGTHAVEHLFGRKGPMKIRVDGSRRNSVDADAMAGGFLVEPLGHER